MVRYGDGIGGVGLLAAHRNFNAENNGNSRCNPA
jgi:hypothetical protein